MPDMLRKEIFSPDNVGDVADFFCGDQQWDRFQAIWIKEQAVKSIAQHGTEVFLYYNDQDELVAFGSIGKTRRRYPPPDGEYIHLSIIPSLAIQSQFQGQPNDGSPKYSHQIMEDLIAQARQQGSDILTLDVHQENVRAIKVYEKFGFVALGDIYHDHIKMFLRLS
jgi:ribosomal protein S18 acetylase RimI-like enzyme